MFTLDKLPDFKVAVTNALRTDESNASDLYDRFVEIRPGTVELLLASRHHLVVGRRGVGKTTLLQYARYKAESEGYRVAVVDLESHKARHYPDVLIEVLIDLIDGLDPNLPWWKPMSPGRGLSRRAKRIRRALLEIRARAPEVDYTRSEQEERKAAAGVNLAAKRGPLSAGGGVLRGRQHRSTATSTFQRQKIDDLRELTPAIQRLLRELVSKTPKRSCLLFLDDFYFVSKSDQARVLDFLHGATKGTGAWLKIGGVGGRLKTYMEGDPPVGMKERDDVHRLALDLTLESYKTAQQFLESVLGGICQPLDMSVRDILTDGARQRLVIASGGAVSRDYLTLILEAVEIAHERHVKSGKGNQIRITTEDVTKASSRRAGQKEGEELSRDADQDAPILRQRWRDIREFAKSRDGGATHFVLVRTDLISDSEWGREVSALEEHRLLHRISNQTPNTDAWRGINCVVYMLDYGFLANQRLTASDYWDFWKGQRQLDRLRRATWVYSPDWRGDSGADPRSE